MIEVKGKYGKANVMIDEVEESCMKQIYGMMNHPAFSDQVVIMPDTHAGAGSVIGFTMPLTDKVIPNIIGVDIGCGMLMHTINDVNIDYFKEHRAMVDTLIRQAVPTGMNVHGIPRDMQFDMDCVKSLASINLRHASGKLAGMFNVSVDYMNVTYDNEYFQRMCKRINHDPNYAFNSLGTLGGGNHFIEFGVDSIELGTDLNNSLCITIHTGSRKLGLDIATYHQKLAKKELDGRRNTLLKDEITKIVNETTDTSLIPDLIEKAKRDLRLFPGVNFNGLEYLTGEQAADYMIDMFFAQAYAHVNRHIIMRTIRDLLYDNLKIGFDRKLYTNYPTHEIECVHNYINSDDLIIRKGAISARLGELCVIPFNMEDGLMVCIGSGNADWNYSSAHGAGRLMGRSQAKKVLKWSDADDAMREKDIYTSVIPLDEVRGAYKDKDTIIEALSPTLKLIRFVKPILNIKSNE